MSNIVLKKKTVRADSGDTWINVEIRVGARDKALTRDEQAAALDHLTSEVMKAIAGTTYVGVPLSRQRVGR